MSRQQRKRPAIHVPQQIPAKQIHLECAVSPPEDEESPIEQDNSESIQPAVTPPEETEPELTVEQLTSASPDPPTSPLEQLDFSATLSSGGPTSQLPHHGLSPNKSPIKVLYYPAC